MTNSYMLLMQAGDSLLRVVSVVWLQDELCGCKMNCVVARWTVWLQDELCGYKMNCVVARWTVWLQDELGSRLS